MKTAPAAPEPRSNPSGDRLADRYGEIGISAVAAAAPFTRVRKPSGEARPVRYPLSMD